MNSQPNLPYLLVHAWRTLLAIAVALLVVSTGYSNDTHAGQSDMSSHHFWKHAEMTGQREVALSELAISRATNPQVRTYAQHMVSDHQQMKQDLVAMRGPASSVPVASATAIAPAATVSTDTTAVTPSATVSTTAPSATVTTSAPAATTTTVTATPAPMVTASTTTTGPVATPSTAVPDPVATARSSSSVNDNATAVDAYSKEAAATPNTFSGTPGNPEAADTAAHPSEHVTDAVDVDAPARSDTDVVATRSTVVVNDNATALEAPPTTTTVMLTTPAAGSVAYGADIRMERGYQELSAKTGADFDKAYLRMMEDDHKKAIALFERCASDATDPNAQTFASKYLPTLRQHLAEAQQLQRSI